MSSLRTASPRLRNYFKENYIPQICEALLCGLLVTCPEDPLRYLERMIMAIIENGLESLHWDMCIDPLMKQNVRILSETCLEQLFGLDDQLTTPELMIKACTFYTGHLVKTYFRTWKEITMPHINVEDTLAEKMEKAIIYCDSKLKKFLFHQWYSYTKNQKAKFQGAILRIQKIFQDHRQRNFIAKWRDIVRIRNKIREEELILKHESELKNWKKRLKMKTSEEFSKSMEFDISQLPENAVLQIFSYLGLRDVIICGQVNHSWMVMIQITKLWNAINFSTVKNTVTDKYVVSTLQKWRLNVLCLNFRGCLLRPKTLKYVSHCRNLQELNVSDCSTLTDEAMRHISEGCHGVLYLNLSNTSITNKTMRLLPKHFHNLQNLSLAYCRKFTDKGLQYLNLGNGCHKLIYLDLSGCTQVCLLVFSFQQQATSSGAQAASSSHVILMLCTVRSTLFRGNKRITDACFKFIDKNYPNINHIYMVDCKGLTDGSLKSLSPLKQLTVLNLANCVRIGDVGLRQFLDGPSSIRIRELNLSNCMQLGDASIVKLSERCRNLNYLSLRNCEQLTDQGIEYIVNIFSLVSLDLSGTVISNEGLIMLSRHKKLKELSLSECYKITDLGIQAFCKNSVLLEHLDVSYCLQLSDDIIKTIAIYCVSLTSLSIAGCPQITDLAIEMLSAKCRYLHILDISGCIRLTDQILDDLKVGCKQLRILKMQYCRHISMEAAHKMSSVVQHQEYSCSDPPSWFGYDGGGNPLNVQYTKPFKGVPEEKPKNKQT
uniref:F-box and leucine-rich repeat protein 13 n=1 Tax=Ictidomys tridecemlineatus TaxID=43179 RepID=A0A287DAA7_ICTTR